MEGDVCVAASPGKCDDTVVSVHVVWTAETSRFVRVEGGQGSVCNLSLTDGSMVGVTLLRELAGKLSKRLPYLFGAGQEADPSTFVRLVPKRSQGGGAGVRLECAVGGRPGWASKLAVCDEAFVQGMPSDVTATAGTT